MELLSISTLSPSKKDKTDDREYHKVLVWFYLYTPAISLFLFVKINESNSAVVKICLQLMKIDSEI